MSYSYKREGFSMLVALSIIVLMSTVAVFVMSLSGKVVKVTTQQYRKEQVALLAKSYTELAILAVMSDDRNSSCIEEVNGQLGTDAQVNKGEGYRIRANIAFIGDASAKLGTCTNVLSSTVVTPQSPLNIIVDTYVEYKELDNPHSDWITYHRRSLQKI